MDNTQEANPAQDCVLRVHRDRNFSIIHLHAVQDDPNLSWKAKGLHTYLVTRPDGWRFRFSDLLNRASDGKEAVQTGLRELADAGYLSRVANRGENGQVRGWIWIIRETPLRPEGGETRQPGNPADGNPAPSNNGSVVRMETAGNHPCPPAADPEGAGDAPVEGAGKGGSETPSESQNIDAVFADWRAVTGRDRRKLTNEHRTKIRARLREGYTVAELRLAIRGAWATPFMRGQNDRETDYTYPKTIFRDADCVDRHIRAARLKLTPEPWWPPTTEPTPTPRTTTEGMGRLRVDDLVGMGIVAV